MALDPLGRFAYVTAYGECGNSGITTFKIDPASGWATQWQAFSNHYDAAPVADCTGTYLYGANSALLAALRVDPSSGALTEVPGSPYPKPEDMISWSGPMAVACPTTPIGAFSSVSPLTTPEYTLSFPVQWSATGNSSTIRDFTVYVSDNGGPFTSWLTTTATQANFSGVSGHTYGFYSIARDLAGNLEYPKYGAEATTYVDAVKPVSHVSSLPATARSPNLQVQWSGTDAGGPGIRNYNIYMSDNGGPFNLWQSNTIANQAWLVGNVGHSYSFYSQATDTYGVQEIKSAPDATTQVPLQMPQDVNHDGLINCVDLNLVKAALGSKPGQSNWNAAADINGDSVIDVRDLAAVSQMLIPGTSCN